jgi:hypothetical protein
MDNPDKLATLGLQDDDKQNNTIVLDATICKITYKQLEVKMNRTSIPYRNRNGHLNTELITQRHIIGQHKTNFKISNTDPTNKPGVNSGGREG